MVAASLGIVALFGLAHGAEAAKPTRLAFTTSAKTLSAGQCSTSVRIQRQDSTGKAVAPSSSTTVSLSASPGPVTYYSNSSCTSAVTSTRIGAYSSSVRVYAKGTKSGSHTLTASASGLTSATQALTVKPASASTLSFTAQPTGAEAGHTLAPVSVTLKDTYGNVATSATNTVSLAFGSNPGAATLAGTTQATPASGIATFSSLSVSAGGTDYTLTASASGLTATTTSSTFDITAPVPSPTPSPTPTATATTAPATNQVEDPGFESGVSNFYAQDTGDSAIRSTSSPIMGTASLKASLNGWGSNVWWTKSVRGTSNAYASAFTITATVRGDVTSANSNVLLCADTIYVGASTMLEKCATLSRTAASQVVSATLTLDSSQELSTVNIRLTLDGATPVMYSLDDVSATLTTAGTGPAPSPSPTATATASPSPSPSPTATASPSPTPTVSPSPTPTATIGPISAVWANDGGDKVTRDEKRASTDSAAVVNPLWDGTKIKIFGGRNEVVSFNAILEAATQAASNVSVEFNRLEGPAGSVIETTPAAAKEGVFDWTRRPIELFYVRYLQIKGLSRLSYETYDERHIPKRMQRPWTGSGYGSGTWNDRPDHDKYYPDIAVPMELVPTFDITAGQNQSVWADMYIPKSAQPGLYSGTFTILQNGAVTHQIPVELTVKNFTLPDVPSAKTMVYLGYPDIAQRYAGTAWPNTGTSEHTLVNQIRDRHFLLAHRHKISMIDSDPNIAGWTAGEPSSDWIPRLNGTLFTATNGYDGPGVGVGNDVYSIGTYGGWRTGTWSTGAETAMRTYTDKWESWFSANFPNVERFLYLIDESTNYTQTEQWASWIQNNPGVGKNLMSFATANLTDAVNNVPSLDIAASWFHAADKTTWQAAADSLNADSGKRVYLYNGKRPAAGSFATEDDGVALRELPWGQYKNGVDRWFFWEATYYNDYQTGRGQTDVFTSALTFGSISGTDSVTGQTGWNYSNGDGVLMYPGADKIYASSSYGLNGPIASLRLKHWRRGIQDIDYVTLASQINPTRVQQIVDALVPKVLWENGVTDPDDPTWVRTDISWPTDPAVWEQYRAELAAIIEAGQ